MINQKLVTAAKEGNTDLVARLIQEGADPHYDNARAFRESAAKGHIPVMEIFLQHGVSVDECPERLGDPAFTWSVLSKQFNAARFLLSRGADMAVNPSALILSVANGSHESVYFLLENATVPQATLNCALCWAIEKNHFEIIQRLILAGADIHSNDNKPIELAIRYNRDALICSFRSITCDDEKWFKIILNMIQYTFLMYRDFSDDCKNISSIINLCNQPLLNKEVVINSLRRNLNEIISNMRNADIFFADCVANVSIMDAAYSALLTIAELCPLNSEDVIALTDTIDPKNLVVVSTGHQFDIKSLINYHNQGSYKSSLGETEGNKSLVNPITNQLFSKKDADHIIFVARQKGIAILDIRTEVSQRMHWSMHRGKPVRSERLNSLNTRLTENPCDIAGRLERAFIYEEQKQNAQALQDYRAILDLNPENDIACKAIARLAQQRQIITAVATTSDHSNQQPPVSTPVVGRTNFFAASLATPSPTQGQVNSINSRLSVPIG